MKKIFLSCAIASFSLTAANSSPIFENVFGKEKKSIYIVDINPFYTFNLIEKARLNGYNLSDPEDTFPGDPAIELPEVRYASDLIASTIGKKPLIVRSWVATQFEVEATFEEAQKLERQVGVIEVRKKPGIGKYPDFILSAYASGDTFSGGENIPWYKTYTNTNDNQSSWLNSGEIHVVEGPLASPISIDLNIISNSNLDPLPWPHDPSPWYLWHAAHVNGVIGGKINNSLIRGINPGIPIRHYGSALWWTQLINHMNHIVAHSQLSFSFGAINLSFNNRTHQSQWNNMFEFSQSFGRSLAIASNNNIILQSAGNNNHSDACGFGYSFNSNHLDWDAILLVGGHDINGQRSTDIEHVFHNTGSTDIVKGSNYGPCVEVWAPSKNITSLRFNSNETQVLSGTSFAAPIASAISLRYGGRITRPLQREWFLKTKAQNTGYYDESGHPINSVRWSSSTSGEIKLHHITNIWSPQNLSGLNNIRNGNFHDAGWNAGGNIGRIVIDLGAAKNVKFIRVTPRSSVALSDVSPIHFSISSSQDINGAISGNHQSYSVPKHGDRAPITIPLSEMHTRFIVLDGHNYGSWLAYSEVEVYGH